MFNFFLTDLSMRAPHKHFRETFSLLSLILFFGPFTFTYRIFLIVVVVVVVDFVVYTTSTCRVDRHTHIVCVYTSKISAHKLLYKLSSKSFLNMIIIYVHYLLTYEICPILVFSLVQFRSFRSFNMAHEI